MTSPHISPHLPISPYISPYLPTGSALGYGLLSQIRGRGKHAEHLMFAAAGLIGASSGLSVGLVATLGSDIAPVERRSEFLGCWKVVPTIGALACRKHEVLHGRIPL